MCKKNPIDNDIYVSLVSELMDSVDTLENSLPDEKYYDVKYVDKTFFKKNMGDVTGISIVNETTKDYLFTINFDRGIRMYFKMREEYNEEGLSYHRKSLAFFKDIIELGLIELRTSPFKVVMNMSKLTAEYFKNLDQRIMPSDTENTIIRNVHDENLNCWGGFGGPVRSSFNDGDIETTIMTVIQRMQQLNLDDVAGSLSRLKILLLTSNNNNIINIDPAIMASLVFKHGLSRYVINRSNGSGVGSMLYFDVSNNNKLVLFADIETAIDYNRLKDILLTYGN